MDTDEVEGVDVLFGSFLFSHHGEWEMFFFPIWSGIYLMREYFEILKISWNKELSILLRKEVEELLPWLLLGRRLEKQVEIIK